MNTHPVYRSLNKPLTLLGVERKLFFLILVASFVLFHLTEALLSSVVVFGVLWVLARAITQADPQLLRVLLTSNRFDARYDPMLMEKGGHLRG
jgi:type IV secretory pathway TrbD component